MPHLVQNLLSEMFKHSPDVSKSFATQTDLVEKLTEVIKGPSPTPHGVMALADIAKSDSVLAMRVMDSGALPSLFSMLTATGPLQPAALYALGHIVAHSEAHATKVIDCASSTGVPLARLLSSLLTPTTAPPPQPATRPAVPPMDLQVNVHDRVSAQLIDSVGRGTKPHTPALSTHVVIPAAPLTSPDIKPDGDSEYSYYSEYDSSVSSDAPPPAAPEDRPRLIPRTDQPVGGTKRRTRDLDRVLSPPLDGPDPIPPTPAEEKRPRLASSSSSEESSDDESASSTPEGMPRPIHTPALVTPSVPAPAMDAPGSGSVSSSEESESDSDGLGEMVQLARESTPRLPSHTQITGPTPAEQREATRLIKRTRNLDEIHQRRDLLCRAIKEG